MGAIHCVLGPAPPIACRLPTLPAVLARSRAYLQRPRQLWSGLPCNLECHADRRKGSDAVGARRMADHLAGMASIGCVQCGREAMTSLIAELSGLVV